MEKTGVHQRTPDEGDSKHLGATISTWWISTSSSSSMFFSLCHSPLYMGFRTVACQFRLHPPHPPEELRRLTHLPPHGPRGPGDVKQKHHSGNPSLGLQVPSEKVFGVGARRVQIPSEEAPGALGIMILPCMTEIPKCIRGNTPKWKLKLWSVSLLLAC